jgi:hypothetical protein
MLGAHDGAEEHAVVDEAGASADDSASSRRAKADAEQLLADVEDETSAVGLAADVEGEAGVEELVADVEGDAGVEELAAVDESKAHADALGANVGNEVGLTRMRSSMASNDELVEVNALGEQPTGTCSTNASGSGNSLAGEMLAVETSTRMWCAATCLRPGMTVSLGVVVAVAMVDMGTSSRALALRQTVEHLVGELESRSSFAPQATGSMLVMVATMESSNAVVAEVGGAEGADAEGKASSFFILPSSESKCASSESNRLEILESSSSRSRVTSGSMAVVGGDTIREGKCRGKIPRTGVSDSKCLQQGSEGRRENGIRGREQGTRTVRTDEHGGTPLNWEGR